jgi:hypothetical protein
METLCIASEKPFSMTLVKNALSRNWRVETSPSDTVVVHSAQSRVYLYPDGQEERDEMTHRLLLDYSDVELAKSILEKIADDSTLTVDNDFGTVLPGNEFVARCKAEKAWDWRRQPIE